MNNKEITNKKTVIKKRIIAIVGNSGAGKDAVARAMEKMTGWEVLCSYTTRPQREGEKEGLEHHFVKRCHVPKEDMLAYTQYGGYEYWVEKKQLAENSIYVIDEKGLMALKSICKDMEIVTVHVDRPAACRLASGVSLSRIMRDKDRMMFPHNYYDYEILNLGSLQELYTKVANIVLKIIGYYETSKISK